MVLSSKRRVLPGPEVNPRQRPPVQRVKDEMKLVVKAESPKKGASLREVLKPKGSLRPEALIAGGIRVKRVNRKGLWPRGVTAAVVTKLRVPEKSRLIKARKAAKREARLAVQAVRSPARLERKRPQRAVRHRVKKGHLRQGRGNLRIRLRTASKAANKKARPAAAVEKWRIPKKLLKLERPLIRNLAGANRKPEALLEPKAAVKKWRIPKKLLKLERHPIRNLGGANRKPEALLEPKAAVERLKKGVNRAGPRREIRRSPSLQEVRKVQRRVAKV
ncbi:MAG: hypothetical protein A3G17_08215 [Planctomycetes bacterium RIFCSPLOWO2_12_FULL_50_35]|nr:MAG: hypothetical protein A3G17_08215 [Planctomycetes bacterium RIFCSPLOWO2_12_FULL_50_35]